MKTAIRLLNGNSISVADFRANRDAILIVLNTRWNSSKTLPDWHLELLLNFDAMFSENYYKARAIASRILTVDGK